MRDILKKYKKKKNIHNVGIIITSLALGFGINMLIFNNTNISNNLKTNINEASVEEVKSNLKEINSDLYIKRNNDNFYYIKVGMSMKNVENISFSLTYNPDNLKIDSIESDDKNIDIMNLSNYPGVNTIVVNMNETSDINKGQEVIKFKITKEKDIPESINLLNGNFTDSEGETYIFSTSGIDL